MLHSGKRTLILDEFGATLDRETAKVIAWLLQKVVRQSGRTLIVATTHRNLFEDLNPTLFILKRFGPEADVKRFDSTLCISDRCSIILKLIPKGNCAPLDPHNQIQQG